MNISDGQRQELLRNMRGLIDDFARDENKFPTISDFEERLDIGKMTVIKYKKIIMDEDRETLLEIFGNERVSNVKDTVKVMKQNLKLYEEIRDGAGSAGERMQAAENIEKTHLSIAQVMYDAPEYLYVNDNNASDQQESPDRQEKTSIPN